MFLRIHQFLMFVLSMDIDQGFPDLAHSRNRYDCAIDAGNIFAVPGKFPLQQNLVPIRLYSIRFQHGRCLGVFGNTEKPLDDRFVFAVSNQIVGPSSACQQTDGIDDDGFSCSGFPGKHGHSLVKTHLKIFNYRKIFNGQLL
ncbi:hypothetical protein SDC9_66632 [bioreactor metagenome]|uniref:Uncharacterized protein n=1 Tax=bioreactor metagenome TaxID=1076179 RepID=A0A644Y0Z0_9ZZZZ